MSLIDQALKKTQSTLNQKSQPNTPPQGTVNIPPELSPQSPFYSVPEVDHSFDITDYLFNRWIIGCAALFFVAILALTTHRFFPRVEHRYMSFYSHLFEPKALPEKIAQLPAPAATALVPTIPLALDGTLKIQNERVALCMTKDSAKCAVGKFSPRSHVRIVC